jgi:DNA-directed RNA polymerase specialized sigma24 family protein
VSTHSPNEFQRFFLRSVRQLTKDPGAALEKMFDLSAQRLVRLAMTITGTQPDAEDALQAAFSRIATRPKLLARADLPWPYLIRTVRNEALRIVQKKRPSRLGDSTDQEKNKQPMTSISVKKQPNMFVAF